MSSLFTVPEVTQTELDAIQTNLTALQALEYILLSASATVANERILAVGNALTLTDAGAGGSLTVAAPESPRCRIYSNAAVALADNVEATVSFNSTRKDNDTMASAANRITIKTAGDYMIGFDGRLAAAGDYTTFYVLLRLNGTTVIAQSSPGGWADAAIPPLVHVATFFPGLIVNDFLEVRASQNNTANVSRNLLVDGNGSPEFWAVKV